MLKHGVESVHANFSVDRNDLACRKHQHARRELSSVLKCLVTFDPVHITCIVIRQPESIPHEKDDTNLRPKEVIRILITIPERHLNSMLVVGLVEDVVRRDKEFEHLIVSVILITCFPTDVSHLSPSVFTIVILHANENTDLLLTLSICEGFPDRYLITETNTGDSDSHPVLVGESTRIDVQVHCIQCKTELTVTCINVCTSNTLNLKHVVSDSRWILVGCIDLDVEWRQREHLVVVFSNLLSW